MHLLARYQQAVLSGAILNDPVQRDILAALQIVFDELVSGQSIWQRLRFKPCKIQGLYFHGGVGIGKTFLMDLFFDELPLKKKKRMHFHHFMRDVQLKLGELQGQANPLERVALDFSKQARVLCFDEFFVHDIADAMILGRLFEALFRRGVVLVTTSNLAPDQLYQDGLHRARFLPAIELLKHHCKVLKVTSQEDYRLLAWKNAGIYFQPANNDSEQQLHRWFEMYAHHSGEPAKAICVEKRMIMTRFLCQDIVWFDFDALCSVPRSQVDYLVIAQRFPYVIVSNVPQFQLNSLNSITYFIHLIDVFYDNGTRLILSAKTKAKDLYPEDGPKAFDFQRTLSRLTQMQSADYFFHKNS